MRVASRFKIATVGFTLLATASALTVQTPAESSAGREHTSINGGWKFWRSESNPDGIIYDERPDLVNLTDVEILKPWILPSGNDFISDASKRHNRPEGNPATDVKYVQVDFDDGDWESVTLPHDWAIKGPFYTEPDGVAIVGGGMGRLPVFGVGWYRKKLSMDAGDKDKMIYLDIDGAMSYAMVWLNEKLVGGWPYPYNSFRLDLTPYMKPGDDNQLAIRLDNPVQSARWYPGGGIYRNVWVTKVEKTHVAQWGTFMTTEDVSAKSATLNLVVDIENEGDSGRDVEAVTTVHAVDSDGAAAGKVATFPRVKTHVSAGYTKSIKGSTKVSKPALWGPPPTQKPNMYVAVTTLYANGKVIDTYETSFGIRNMKYDPNQGLLVNGERIYIQGTNQHHDLGAIGAAFNHRAAQRHLEILQSFGSNAIRMSHNPPAPELMDLADTMGFVVMDEVFDCWQHAKTTNDFSLIFDDWHEQDIRSFMRRDRNHPSIFTWSFGNEVAEQTNSSAVGLAQTLHDIVHSEDSSRPATCSMNAAKPDMPFPGVMDLLSLNYQGEGIRDTPAYSQLSGTATPPLYDAFHDAFPKKVLLSTETSSGLSTRGTYMFPVAPDSGAPVNDTSGGNSTTLQVSAYDLYSSDFGSSADKVFAAQDSHPFVAGEFVWTGWDYIGEPTPYYGARSSYSGIVDLAGFKKSRFFLYQSRWKSDLPMAHILPHWNWPDRVGLETPVHVFTSGDEAELFLNGKSLGRKQKEDLHYRIRWDDVKYKAGELHVVAYKNGKKWAEDTVRTTGEPAQLRLTADHETISADGYDLSYITAEVLDSEGNVVPQADNAITFSLCGAGSIVATDNGNPADLTAFPSPVRNAFSGMALAIVRSKDGKAGKIAVKASAEGLESAWVKLQAE